MSSNIFGPYQKKPVAPSEKVAPSEEAEKGNGTLNDIEKTVVTIRQNDLDKK